MDSYSLIFEKLQKAANRIQPLPTVGVRLAKLFMADGARDYLAGYR